MKTTINYQDYTTGNDAIVKCSGGYIYKDKPKAKKRKDKKK